MEQNTPNTATQSYIIEPEKAGMKIILSLVCSVIAAVVGYYLYLPALNFKAIELWVYMIGVVLSFIVFLAVFSGATKKPEYGPFVRKKSIVPVIIAGVLMLAAIVGFLVGSTLLRAKAHSELLHVSDKIERDFARDVPEMDAARFSSVPRLDEETARQLASKALGDLGGADTVSQFTIYPMYTQINYKQKPVRVVPLQYADIIKWFTNTSRGLPGYITIDMANEATNFHRFEEGSYIRYSPAEHFGRLLKRHLRFEYPTYLFGDSTFEIDEDGTPYWITPRLDNTLGLFGGTDVIGVVVVKADSQDGAHEYYSVEQLRDDPNLQWIDRVYSSDILIQQYNFHGKLHGGFWNSILGQRAVRNTTLGHNYLALNDDVYLYSGVTSATSDQSIIGFILVNQRTKAADYYDVSGATEAAAVSSAEGMVADFRYRATFPILINVAGQPTYFMGLKDVQNNNQLIQQFALVNVRDFNAIRATAKTVNETFMLYMNSLAERGITPAAPGSALEDLTQVSGSISEIRTQLIDGNSVYYLALADKKGLWYRLSANVYEGAILLNVGGKISFVTEIVAEDKKIIDILEIR
ncbi:MAG: CvpA family protein [Oscillospiraceae bacterium]|nr:CvpA family protein [Oscillospiraceae bacterium]